MYLISNLNKNVGLPTQLFTVVPPLGTLVLGDTGRTSPSQSPCLSADNVFEEESRPRHMAVTEQVFDPEIAAVASDNSGMAACTTCGIDGQEAA